MMRCACVINLIQHSFELAAERCEDPTPLVYKRLHRIRPETVAMFRSDGSELVKGSMLAFTIEALLDFAGERNGKFRIISSEVASHEACGTPRDLFIAFFAVIADTLRELLAAEWTDEIAAAWKKLLTDIEQMISREMAELGPHRLAAHERHCTKVATKRASRDR